MIPYDRIKQMTFDEMVEFLTNIYIEEDEDGCEILHIDGLRLVSDSYTIRDYLNGEYNDD